jgi:hypothetical protein
VRIVAASPDPTLAGRADLEDGSTRRAFEPG